MSSGIDLKSTLQAGGISRGRSCRNWSVTCWSVKVYTEHVEGFRDGNHGAGSASD